MKASDKGLKIFRICVNSLLGVLTIVLGVLFIIQTVRVNGNFTPAVLNIAITQILPIIIIWAVIFVISLFTPYEKIPIKPLKAVTVKVNKKTFIILNVAYAVLIALCIGFTIGYMVQSKHFTLDFTASVTSFIYYLLPFAITALVLTGVRMIFVLNPNEKTKKEGDEAAVKKEKRVILILQIAVIVIAVTFIIIGAVMGQAQTVMNKAVRICMECIGLG